MTEQYFTGVKVGDRVWSCVYGWGYIDDISEPCFRVMYDVKNEWERFESTGKAETFQLQTLFWDEVTIIPPPKPKRMVKKELQGWVFEGSIGKTFSNFAALPDSLPATLTWEEEE